MRRLFTQKAQEIMDKELDGWSIRFITSGGGLCVHDKKEIWLDTCHANIPFLLHEIAHAKLSKKHKHDAIWGDLYTALAEKYFKREGTMTKHTKGEWKVEDCYNTFEILAADSRIIGQQVVCKVPKPNQYMLDNKSASTIKQEKQALAVAEANAHLIAAAPDMLEALKEMLDWMETNFQLESGNYEDPDMSNIARQAEQALAKATKED